MNLDLEPGRYKMPLKFTAPIPMHNYEVSYRLILPAVVQSIDPLRSHILLPGQLFFVQSLHTNL